MSELLDQLRTDLAVVLAVLAVLADWNNLLAFFGDLIGVK